MDNQNQFNTPDAAELAGIVPVDSIEQFAGMVAHWHNTKIRQMEHMLSVPSDGSCSMEIGDKEVVLSGEKLEGFKAGISFAMATFGELPFVAEMEDDLPVVTQAEIDNDKQA